MDSSAAAILGQSLPFSSYAAAPSYWKSAMTVGRRVPSIGILSSGFCDQSHLQYYNAKKYRSSSSLSFSVAAGGMATVMSGKEDKESAKDIKAPKKMKKKQLKLMKELSKDLSTFSQMGFGLDNDGGVVDQVKRDMMTEAADLLLERLQKLRAEDKEQKRKMKEEKARLKAASRSYMDCEMSSSSSSSESSSDEECGEVVNMKNLKQAQVDLKGLPQVVTMPAIDSIQMNVAEARPVSTLPAPSLHKDQNVSCSADIAWTKLGHVCEDIPVNACSKKIEVCMGGKCKKSGGSALLEEFRKAVGIEGAVLGCKCMGKCRDGPNVKVLNGVDNSQTSNSNSLCIGVGLEDVEMIVANFMGQNQNHLRFAAVS